jgi:hypothetical protein
MSIDTVAPLTLSIQLVKSGTHCVYGPLSKCCRQSFPMVMGAQLGSPVWFMAVDSSSSTI